jgi:hypothetical protein
LRNTDAPNGAETESAQWAIGFARQIASTPRFAGSNTERAARALCNQRLRKAGFKTHEEEFTFSQVPARLGPFLCGTVFAIGMFLSGHVAAAHLNPIAGIAIAMGSAV